MNDESVVEFNLHTQVVFILSGGSHVMVERDTACITANTHITKEDAAAIRLISVDTI